MQVMIVVTHLLGTGHLARALTLARSFLCQGHTATVVSGGMPETLLDRGDVPLIQLPPLRSDGVVFTRLLDQDGNVATPTLRARRAKALVQALHDLAPDVLITELFPFGRRVLTDEFLSILKAAHQMSRRPLICASIRDILAPPSKPAKAEMTEDLITTWYDGVLVHADEDLVPLSLSWPLTDRLRTFLHYTGFVAAPPAGPHPDGLGRGEIIVSAGGGDVGRALYQAARGAASLDENLRWRVLVGGANTSLLVKQLCADAPANFHAEPARLDFRSMLYQAAASVSMCGYNTALDVLQAGTPALFVPFDKGGEMEQALRANALARQDGIEVLASAALSPLTLLSGLGRVMTAPNRPSATQGFDGAAETVRLVTLMRETQSWK